MHLLQVMGVNSKSTREDLEILLKKAHIVSLHTPLTSATEGLIGASGRLCLHLHDIKAHTYGWLRCSML